MTKGQQPAGFSIIICCHNSADLIAKTLQYIFNQTLDRELKLEIIVVDNASTDGTSEVAMNKWAGANVSNKNISFKMVTEPLLGLTNARMTGVQIASYDYIIYCDDDNFLDPDYCTEAYAIMHSDPSIGACGGNGESIFEGEEKPEWFDDFQSAYACGPQRVVKNSRFNTLYGAGLVIRKDIIQKLIDKNYRPLLTDRRGEDLSSGGDEELCHWCTLLGWQMVYSEKLRFKHLIKKYRLSLDYLRRLYRSFGQSQAYKIPLLVLLKGKENSYERFWLFQMIKWTVIGIKYFFFQNHSLALQKELDCVYQRARLEILWQNRTKFNRIMKEQILFRKSIVECS